MGTFKIGKVVMKSLFKKPATLMYPVIPREWQDRTRGSIDIDKDNCILCGICGRKCPTDAITVDRKGGTWEIMRMQCIQCGCCVEVCPKKCLDMNPQYTEPDVEKVIDTVEVPVQEKKPAAKADASAEGGEATPAGGDGLSCNLDECVYCGLCVKECPVDALEVDRQEKVWKVDQDTCVSCGACVDKCPKKCLTLGGGEPAADAAGSTTPAVTPAQTEETWDENLTPQDGRLKCDRDSCIYCGICVKECQVDALTVDRQQKLWAVDGTACVLCSACVERCPKECLSITTD